MPRFLPCTAALALFIGRTVYLQAGEACDHTELPVLAQQARQAAAMHQYDKALQELKRALASCPSEHTLLLELAQVQSDNRDFSDAIASAQEYLKSDASSVPARLTLANAYLMSGRLAEAKAEAQQALRGEPGHAAALEISANADYLLGDFGSARRTIIELMDRHPNDEEAPYMLGRMYYQEGAIDLAIGQFERVLKLQPSSYKAFDNLGLCHEAKGDNQTATRYFLTSIRLVEKDHPNYDWPYANLAELLLKTGQDKKAFDAAAMAANRNPQSARDFYLGGKALWKLGKSDLSLNWLERSTSLDPKYPEPLYLLARIYHQLGQQQKSEQARKKFSELQAYASTRRR